MKRPAPAAESRHMGRVAGLGCALCRRLGYPDTPATVHHIREGQGMSQRASHMLTIPLCPACHFQPEGIHGNRNRLRMAKVTELDLLADTLARLL